MVWIVEFSFTRIYLARCVSRALISTTATGSMEAGEKGPEKRRNFGIRTKKGAKVPNGMGIKGLKQALASVA